MHSNVLPAQNDDVAEPLRSAVLHIVDSVSSGEPATITSGDARLPPLLHGLERALCDGLKPHLTHIWPVVSAFLFDRAPPAQCDVAAQREVLQEVRQFAMRARANGAAPPGAQWLSRIWIVCSLRQGSLLPAVLALGGVRDAFYREGALLATAGGVDFLVFALRALADARLCFLVSAGDYKLFPAPRGRAGPGQGPHPPALREAGASSPSAPPASPGPAPEAPETRFHVRCRYVTSSMVQITAQPAVGDAVAPRGNAPCQGRVVDPAPDAAATCAPRDLKSAAVCVAEAMRRALAPTPRACVDGAARDCFSGAAAEAWLQHEAYAPTVEGAQGLLQYLRAHDVIEAVEPTAADEAEGLWYAFPAPSTPRGQAAVLPRGITTHLEDVSFGPGGDALEPMEGAVGTRRAGAAEFAREYLVLRGAHAFLWGDPELYRRNCEEDAILDLRGAAVADADALAVIALTGPGLEGPVELLVEDAAVRGLWVRRLRQAAGRAVVVVPEVQTWRLLRGWAAQGRGDPFGAQDAVMAAKGYAWDGAWTLAAGGAFGADTWQYALGPGFPFHPEAGKLDCVRQRRWWRTATPRAPEAGPGTDGDGPVRKRS